MHMTSNGRLSCGCLGVACAVKRFWGGIGCGEQEKDSEGIG